MLKYSHHSTRGFDETEGEGDDRGRIEIEDGGGRSDEDDRLSEGDDHEQAEALGEVLGR